MKKYIITILCFFMLPLFILCAGAAQIGDTDGNGALTFLLALIQRYLELSQDLPSELRKGILYWKESPTEKEISDDFLRYGDFDGEKEKAEIHDVHRLPAVYEKNYLRLTYLAMSAQQLQAAARALQLTMTEFMTAVYMLAVIQTAEKPIQNSIGVDIAVKLRCKTCGHHLTHDIL